MDLPPLHFYPLFTALLLPFTFLATYLVAIGLNHTEVDWPYISDTSASPPESCIFSQLVNVGALFLGIVVYIRYKQVRLCHLCVVNENLRTGRRSLFARFMSSIAVITLPDKLCYSTPCPDGSAGLELWGSASSQTFQSPRSSQFT